MSIKTDRRKTKKPIKMEKVEYRIFIEAPTREKTKEAMEALMDLKKSMSLEDLLLFSKKVKADPGLIQKAKKWL